MATHTWKDGWCRHLDLAPSGRQLAIGGNDWGNMFVFDVKTQSVVQERQLSPAQKSKFSEEVRQMMGGYLAVHSLGYFDEGRKVIYRISGITGWRFMVSR